jgi:DNA-binding LytR/AlgR family response regulator
MKKIRCLLVDDEPLAIALLRNHVSQLDFLEVTGECNNALKALEFLRHTEIDLLFLDIHMPAISGIEFLKTLRNPPKVILTTAYREYALDGYELDILDYLLKPITFERFFKSVERYLRGAATVIAPASVAEGTVAVFLKSGYRNVKIGVDDILYIESLKDYVKVHTPGGVISAKYKISELENELGGNNFLRIHRSFIVNIKQITAFTASDVEIGKTELPIGETYRELVFAALKRKNKV